MTLNILSIGTVLWSLISAPMNFKTMCILTKEGSIVHRQELVYPRPDFEESERESREEFNYLAAFEAGRGC